MTSALIIAGIAGWVLCGFFAYGLTLAHYQRAHPTIADQRREVHRRYARETFAAGYAGLLVALLLYRGYGFMWRLPPRDES